MSHSKTNFLKFIGVFSIVLGIHGGAFGRIGGLGDDIKSAYKYDPPMFFEQPNIYCPEMSIGDACVGDSYMSSPGVCGHIVGNGTESDEGAVLMLVARQVKTTGAKFCVTQIQGENTNESDPWLGYYNPSGNVFKCFWLCMPGYGGSECSESAESAGQDLCDPTEISREAFSGYRLARNNNAPSIEDIAWMFHRWTNGCSGNGNTYQEHESFIAVSGWLPSKHGARVASMIAWSDRYGYSNMDSDAKITTAGESLVMCSPGYKPNPSGTDCEPVNTTACLLSSASFCDGFARDKFNEVIHDLDSTGSGNCLRYFCKDKNQAFPSLGDTSCVDCANGVKGGPHPKNGVCVTCNTGQYFDSTSGECKTARGFSKKVLQYGPSEAKSTTKVTEECWTITDPDTYKACVGIGPEPAFTPTAETVESMVTRIDNMLAGKDQLKVTLPSGLTVYGKSKNKMQK